MKTENFMNNKLQNSKILYIPIFNCNRNDFSDRLDIYSLLKQYKIEVENLIFYDDIKLKEDLIFMEYAFENEEVQEEEPKGESNRG